MTGRQKVQIRCMTFLLILYKLQTVLSTKTVQKFQTYDTKLLKTYVLTATKTAKDLPLTPKNILMLMSLGTDVNRVKQLICKQLFIALTLRKIVSAQNYKTIKLLHVFINKKKYVGLILAIEVIDVKHLFVQH